MALSQYGTSTGAALGRTLTSVLRWGFMRLLAFVVIG